MVTSGFSACRFRDVLKKTAVFSGSGERRSGFTLIELIVVVAIISIMLSIAVVSAPANHREFLLSTSQEQLRTLISRSRALSINSVARGQVLVGQQCGYGTRVDKALNSAFIYYSCDSKTFGPGSTELSGTLNQMTLDKSLSFSSDEDIFFLPPDPTVYISGSMTPSSVTVGITAGNGESRGVEVNSAGLIDLVM